MKRNSPLLDAVQSWWLLAATTIAVLPLAASLPLWLVAAATIALGLRAWQILVRSPAPSPWVLVFAAITGAGGVALQYGLLFGQNAGIALLVLLSALKQLESRTRRDGMAVVLLCYFLGQAGLLHSQSIPAATALFLVVATSTAALGSLADSRLAPARLLRFSALALAQSVPFLLILFVFLPRVSGPLWGLPQDAYTAQTGLSDTMAPGSIGQLSLSDAVAFRARFDGALPPRDRLYWRGPVLTLFDGTVWRPARFPFLTSLPYAPDDGRIEYEVTLEPHNKPWLFALELPASLPSESYMTNDYQLLARMPVTERQRYVAVSRVGQPAGIAESPQVLNLARRLPRDRNPRTVALGRIWRESERSDADILKAALSFFVRQRLTYTLSPPRLGADGVDEFLFETRQGFCEHFAGAFVVAMRAAGVPARVVTGYLGGELNPIDGYMTIRQSDAHAWAEVWLEGVGWQRVDPTAASFPQRVDFNLAAAVPAGDPLPLLMRADWSWLREARLAWEAVTNNWNQWVLGYTAQRQRDLLGGFGMPDWRRMTLALSFLSALAVLALALWARQQRRRIDPAQALWLRALARLARRGLPHRPWEGPHDYAARVAAARPDLADSILDLARIYGGVRYGSIAATDLLRRRVAAFRP